MRIITLVPLAALAVALSGCANKELQETSYSYESKSHSGASDLYCWCWRNRANCCSGIVALWFYPHHLD